MASANRVFHSLRAILNRAFTHGLAADDTEWRKVKAFTGADEPVTRFLTDAESQRLISASRAGLRRLVKAALFNGARFSEPTGLRCANFNTDTDLIYIRPGKSGKGRHVPLNVQGLDQFKAATAGKPRSAPHFYASLLAQAGADLLTISKLLGRADTRITDRHYAHRVTLP